MCGMDQRQTADLSICRLTHWYLDLHTHVKENIDCEIGLGVVIWYVCVRERGKVLFKGPEREIYGKALERFKE